MAIVMMRMMMRMMMMMIMIMMMMLTLMMIMMIWLKQLGDKLMVILNDGMSKLSSLCPSSPHCTNVMAYEHTIIELFGLKS
eukprot:1917870-Karenia_brevis.AAC.1